MIDIFCPDECVESVLEINLESLKRIGMSALILDLDNTLLGWEADEIPRSVAGWVSEAKRAGFKVCIASNGTKSRVGRIAEALSVPAISKAVKPRKRPFRKALAILGAPPERTVVIGDQVFTDVLGGNRMELYTILIKPMSTTELKTTKMVRKVEKRVLSRLSKKGRIDERDLHDRWGGESELPYRDTEPKV